MDNENNESDFLKSYIVSPIDFSNYILPDKTNYIGKKYILNGEQNSFFRYVKERYLGSTTNSSVIDKIVGYVIGGGLTDLSGQNINKFISKRDLRLIVQDFKIYGQYSIQVIWSQGSKLLKEEAKPIKIKHIPTDKIGLNVNSIGEIDGYWYSFDWTNTSKYKPKLFKKFDGIYTEDNNIEILTVNRISPEPYFPQPDYLSGLQYSHLEEELSNSHLSYILNDFSIGTIIVAKGGVPATEELRQKYAKDLLQAICGSSNKKKPMVYFTNSLESDIEIKRLEVNNLDTQLVYFSEEAKETR